MGVIHKINITAEAAFDITEALNLGQFDKRTLKAEVEEYIAYREQAGRLPWWGYFHADYIDEDSGRRLKLFFYKGDRFGLMQVWNLAGVCTAEDFSEDAEAGGQIRAWLNTKLQEPDGEDWAVRLRVNEILKKTEKTLWVNVLEEVLSEFDGKRDKETAEKVAFLQSVYFEFGGGRTRKKNNRDRTRG